MVTSGYTGRSRFGIILIFMAVVLLVSMVFASSVGAVKVPLWDIYRIVLNKTFSIVSAVDQISVSNSFIVWQVRLPRVVLSAMVGASLAVSGAVLQGIFRNPMAEPYIIGVSFGGAFGATLVILFGSGFGLISSLSIPLFAFAGALATTMVVYRLSRVGGSIPISALILSGIAISSFLSALISLMMTLKSSDLYTLIFWLMGGFSAKNWHHVAIIAPFILLSFPVVLVYSKDLNVMLLGGERAKQLGVDVDKVKKILIAASAMLAGAAVSVSGLIGFVGLIIPHTVRMIIGPDNRILIPSTALAGAIFLVMADTMSRIILAPKELPVGIITALFGAPFFIYLLRLRKDSLI